ncbi:MAG: putative disulfide formation protein [Parcubacteria group bacterium GW2011_GWC1_35_8]|nr:MAG: putative disulfide formation protein [Parcubacteria group bacterium GW2011_GWC1_35_8]KKP87781.1 MAG: putative disulfide formation protein [Candidatus Nomurabacteria bacterium GW2011_GWC2_35_8]
MSTESVHYLNVFLGLGVIALQVLSVIALISLFFVFRNGKRNSFLDFLDKHFLMLSFLISLFASVFPLVYSEIINFLPCNLCWWQRVFMFPAPFLFGIALFDKDRRIIKYVASLLSVGFLITVYQNFFYYFGQNSNLPCDATGVSCYQRLVSEFGGYISIPMMALAAFFGLLTLLAVTHFYPRKIQ